MELLIKRTGEITMCPIQHGLCSKNCGLYDGSRCSVLTIAQALQELVYIQSGQSDSDVSYCGCEGTD